MTHRTQTVEQLTFDHSGLRTWRMHATEILLSGITEHTAGTLVTMRALYGPTDVENQAKVNFIAKKVRNSSQLRPRIHAEVMASAAAVVRMSGARSVVDVGCGEGLLVRALAHEPSVDEITGIDTDPRHLRIAHALVDATSMPIDKTVHFLDHDITSGNLPSLRNVGAITLAEVIEHVPDTDWIDHAFALEPELMVVTTPNVEYNKIWNPGMLELNGFRDPDHKFEFSRGEFTEWAQTKAAEHDYSVSLLCVGPTDYTHGPSNQMAVLQRN